MIVYTVVLAVRIATDERRETMTVHLQLAALAIGLDGINVALHAQREA
jgi:hypothetical protein